MVHSKRLKIAKLPYDWLVKLLTEPLVLDGMPEDAKIVGIAADLGFDQDVLLLKIESQEFHEVPPGNFIPVMELNVREAGTAKRGGEFI
jgi:hypothetical protein